MWGAPSSPGWRHSATTWSQSSGTSKRTTTMIEEKSAELKAKATEEEKARIQRGEA
jgi:hypothetical protein